MHPRNSSFFIKCSSEREVLRNVTKKEREEWAKTHMRKHWQ